MSDLTIESYFLSDYQRIKAELEVLKKEKANNVANESGWVDLHRPTDMVCYDCVSDYTIRYCGCPWSKFDSAGFRSLLDLSDDELLKKAMGTNIKGGFDQGVITRREHTFAYTLQLTDKRNIVHRYATDDEVDCEELIPLEKEVFIDEWVPAAKEEEVKKIAIEYLRRELSNCVNITECEEKKAREKEETS